MIKMAYNKVVYNKKVLIDLTNDTVTSDKLFSGVKAHDKTGKVITGTFLQGYPASFTVEDVVQDSSGNSVFDSASESIAGQYIYVRK